MALAATLREWRPRVLPRLHSLVGIGRTTGAVFVTVAVGETWSAVSAFGTIVPRRPGTFFSNKVKPARAEVLGRKARRLARATRESPLR
jgi:hypothetical protein